MTTHRSKFTFRPDDEPPVDTSSHEDELNLKIIKMSDKITRLTILLLCLIGITAGYFYYYINNRIESAGSSYNAATETLLTNLAAQYSSVEQSFSKQIGDINQETVKIKNDLLKIDKTLAVLSKNKPELKDLHNAVSDFDKSKNELSASIAKIDKALFTLKNDVKTLSVNLDKKITDTADKTKQYSEKTTKELGTINKHIAELVAANKHIAELDFKDTVNKETLDIELKKQQENIYSSIDAQLSNIMIKLKKLETTMLYLEQNKDLFPANTPLNGSAHLPDNTIVEDDIN
ncbi:MAG: hypothetical protein K9L30_09335 [Desulfobacterales bacterium]|nr:hypothetical protein [Desulfobacterales bacterium]